MTAKKRKAENVKENTAPPPSLWTAFALPVYGKSCGERLVFLVMEMSLNADCQIQFDQVTMDRFTETDRQSLFNGTWTIIETKTIDRRLGALLHPFRHVQNAWLPSCYSLQLDTSPSPSFPCSQRIEIPLIFRTTLKSLISRNERPDRWFQVQPFKQASGGIRRLVASLTEHGADFAEYFDDKHLWGKLPLAVPLSDSIFSVKGTVSFLSRLLTFPSDISIPRGALRHVFVYPFGDRLIERDLSTVLLERHPLANLDRWSYVNRLDECIEHLIMNLLPSVPYLSVLFSYLVNVATMQEGHSSVDQVDIKFLVAFFRFVAHSPGGGAPAAFKSQSPRPMVPWFQFPRVSVIMQCGHVFGHRPWIDPPIFHVTHCPHCQVQMHTADIITFRNPFYRTETDHEIRTTALDYIANAIQVPHPIILDPALIAAVCARRKPLHTLLPKPAPSVPKKIKTLFSAVDLSPPPPPSPPPSSPSFYIDVQPEKTDRAEVDDTDREEEKEQEQEDASPPPLPCVDEWYENDPYYLCAVVSPPFESSPPLRFFS